MQLNEPRGQEEAGALLELGTLGQGTGQGSEAEISVPHHSEISTTEQAFCDGRKVSQL